MFLKKQDRQGVRTAAELDRRYNVKKVEGVANDSLKAATEASATAEESRQTASSASQSASEAKAGLEGKVGKTENDFVVEMINKATTVLKLTLNRLVVDSDNFKLKEDGSVEITGEVTAEGGKIGDWHLGKPATLATHYQGTALYSETYESGVGQTTVYLTPEKLYIENRSGLEVAIDSASWADIVRVVNNNK